jgi:DnaJ-class molecular chaperone
MLGLGQKAALEDIKKVYRDLTKKNHPDRHSGEDKTVYERKMVQINEAYKLIMDYAGQFEISFEKDTVE